MKNTLILYILILLFSRQNAFAQTTYPSVEDSTFVSQKKGSISVDSIVHQKLNALSNFVSQVASGQKRNQIADTISSLISAKKKREIHSSWAEGRVPEFSSPYTLSRHELRLNLFGPSSYAISDRFELKSYLSAIIVPNISFKYRFYDKNNFALAYEAGGAIGGFPVAAAGGFVLPGAALGAGTLGIVSLTSIFAKLYGGWKPSKKFTFSVRSEIARIGLAYNGLGGFAAIGSGGNGVALIPINSNIYNAYWLSGGFEADFVANLNNAIVFKSSGGKFLVTNFLDHGADILSKNYLVLPSISWNHGWNKRHLHLTLGLYGIYNPPANTLTQKTLLPIMYYYNIYWIFNNRKKELNVQIN